MINKEKYIKLVSKLNRLTKEEQIHWEESKPSIALRVGVDDVWIDFYKTFYANTYIGIGEARSPSYSEDLDRHYWSQRVVWALIDYDGELEYELPNTEGLWNLLDTIRRTLSDVDSKIESLINAPDLDEDK